MTDARRLSQAISEGDGISILVHVRDLAEAAAAESQGAEGTAITEHIEGIREATTLPVVWLGPGAPADADACLLVVEDAADDLDAAYERARSGGLECIVDVRDDEELQIALERIDPEIFLLSSRDTEEDDDPLDAVLELLPDVPAGKLAIAEIDVHTRDEVLALERAGIDAVLVPAGNVAGLVGGAPPEV